jgi:hypothetical protein
MKTMIRFISDNLLLILGIAGTVVGFLGMISKYIAENRKARMVLACVVLGFLILLGQRIVTHILDVEKVRDEARRNQISETKRDIMQRSLDVQEVIIKKIEDDVVITRYTVEGMARRLERVPLETLGTQLVTIKPSSEGGKFNELKAFAKGTPRMWKLYAKWLDEAGPGASLSLIPGAEKNYNPGLVLAYLMTNQETKRDIETVINNFYHNPDTILNFPDSSVLKRFSDGNGGIKWVVFLKETGGQLIAYADARSFTKELTIHYRLGDREYIRRLLNKPDPNLLSKLSDAFASVNSEISYDSSTKSVVKSMLDKQVSSIAVVDDSSQYVVRLEKVVQQLSVKK